MFVISEEFKLTVESHASKNVRTRLFLEKEKKDYVRIF